MKKQIPNHVIDYGQHLTQIPIPKEYRASLKMPNINDDEFNDIIINTILLRSRTTPRNIYVKF